VRRQDCTKVLENSNSIYISSPKHILQADSIYEGRLGIFCIPSLESLDIDSITDYQLARLIYESKQELT